ncbi:MAG: hypothetical protein LBS59_09330 [Puniceicoccales bacterium]|jgi:hypothetical protein|nr:hypothetical protein [Puniceicoccales bacterium]
MSAVSAIAVTIGAAFGASWIKSMAQVKGDLKGLDAITKSFGTVDPLGAKMRDLGLVQKERQTALLSAKESLASAAQRKIS